MPKLQTLIELAAGQRPLARGQALGGAEEFERGSPSWDSRGAVAAAAGEMHIETVNGIPALFLGRRTRNLLGPEFAPFRDVPSLWRAVAEVSLESVGLSFGNGSLRADATRGVVCLPLPHVAVHPADEVPLPGTAQLGALYQLSAYVRGTGTATLRLQDTRNNVQAEKRILLDAAGVPVGGQGERVPIAGNGRAGFVLVRARGLLTDLADRAFRVFGSKCRRGQCACNQERAEPRP